MSANAAFPKASRLLTPRDYSGVFNQVDYRVSNRYLLVLARSNGQTHPRLGLIIGKKHVRKAVQRNRLKRVLRESFRHRQDVLPSVDLVILARPGLGTLDNQQIRALMDALWDKLSRKAQGTAADS